MITVSESFWSAEGRLCQLKEQVIFLSIPSRERRIWKAMGQRIWQCVNDTAHFVGSKLQTHETGCIVCLVCGTAIWMQDLLYKRPPYNDEAEPS